MSDFRKLMEGGFPEIIKDKQELKEKQWEKYMETQDTTKPVRYFHQFCGGEIVDTGMYREDDRQYSCSKCGSEGHPLAAMTKRDKRNSDIEDVPFDIDLGGEIIRVVQLLLPPDEFRKLFFEEVVPVLEKMGFQESTPESEIPEYSPYGSLIADRVSRKHESTFDEKNDELYDIPGLLVNCKALIEKSEQSPNELTHEMLTYIVAIREEVNGIAENAATEYHE
jgi:predicted RNA-binding Zn-ribbon protein involved in translation (DUF1610 family)